MAQLDPLPPAPENIENAAALWDFSAEELFFIDLYFSRALEEQFIDPIYKDEFDVHIDAVFQALPTPVKADIESQAEGAFPEQEVEDQIDILEKTLPSDIKWGFLHVTAQKEALILAELLQNYLQSKNQTIQDLYRVDGQTRELILGNIYAAYHRQLERDIQDHAKQNQNLRHITPNDLHHLPVAEASPILDQTALHFGVNSVEKRKQSMETTRSQDSISMGTLRVPGGAVESAQINRDPLFKKGFSLKAPENLKIRIPKIKETVEVRPVTRAETNLTSHIRQEKQRLAEQSSQQDTSQEKQAEQVDRYRKYVESVQKAEREQTQQQQKRPRRRVTQNIIKKVVGANPALLAGGATGAGAAGMGGGLVGYYILQNYYFSPEITFLLSFFF